MSDKIDEPKKNENKNLKILKKGAVRLGFYGIKYSGLPGFILLSYAIMIYPPQFLLFLYDHYHSLQLLYQQLFLLLDLHLLLLHHVFQM